LHVNRRYHFCILHLYNREHVSRYRNDRKTERFDPCGKNLRANPVKGTVRTWHDSGFRHCARSPRDQLVPRQRQPVPGNDVCSGHRFQDRSLEPEIPGGTTGMPGRVGRRRHTLNPRSNRPESEMVDIACRDTWNPSKNRLRWWGQITAWPCRSTTEARTAEIPERSHT